MRVILVHSFRHAPSQLDTRLIPKIMIRTREGEKDLSTKSNYLLLFRPV
jgi:hypothetical protein